MMTDYQIADAELRKVGASLCQPDALLHLAAMDVESAPLHPAPCRSCAARSPCARTRAPASCAARRPEGQPECRRRGSSVRTDAADVVGCRQARARPKAGARLCSELP